MSLGVFRWPFLALFLVAGCSAPAPYVVEPPSAYVELERFGDGALTQDNLQSWLRERPAPVHPRSHYLQLLEEELVALDGVQERPQISEGAVLAVVSAYDARCAFASQVELTLADLLAGPQAVEHAWAAVEAARRMHSAWGEARHSEQAFARMADRLEGERAQDKALAKLQAELLRAFLSSPGGRAARAREAEAYGRGARRVAELRQHVWQADRRRKNQPDWEQRIERSALVGTARSEARLGQTREAGGGSLLGAVLADRRNGAGTLERVEAFVAEHPSPEVSEALTAVRQARAAGDAGDAGAALAALLEPQGP